MLQPLYNSYLRSLKPDILRLSSWRGDGCNRVAHMQSADETFETSCPLCLFLWRSWGVFMQPMNSSYHTPNLNVIYPQVAALNLWEIQRKKENSKKQPRPVLTLVWNMGEYTELLCLASWVCKSQRTQTAEKTEVCVWTLGILILLKRDNKHTNKQRPEIKTHRKLSDDVWLLCHQKAETL